MTSWPTSRVTTNLRLQAVTLDDLPAVLAIEADPATNKHRPGGPPSAEDVEEHVRAWVRMWGEHGVGYWVAEHRGEVVGLVGVRPLDFHGRSCWNLYYRFSPSVWGKGLATEAASEAVAVAKAQEPVLPVIARTRPSNAAAVRVAERVGLERRADLARMDSSFSSMAGRRPWLVDDGWRRVTGYGSVTYAPVSHAAAERRPA